MSTNIPNLPDEVDMDVLQSVTSMAEVPSVATMDVKNNRVAEVIEENKMETPKDEDKNIISLDRTLKEENEHNELIKEESPIPTNRPMTDEEYERYIESIQNDEASSESVILGNFEAEEDDFYNDNTVPTVSPKVKVDFVEDSSMSFEETEDDEETENEFGSFEDDKDKENTILKSYADVETVKASNPKVQFIDKIAVDLNNIVITDKPVLQQVEDFNLVFDASKSTFTVVCCQSAYQASMSGLTLSEKNAINNSESDMFTARQKLYKTVYNKIVSMNFPKPKFDDWLKITAFGDWNTLLFGIYCQTFIDDNDFDITCGHCGKVTPVTVNNQSLVEARDKRVFEKIDEVISGITSAQDLLNHSVIHKHFRIMLNDSKIILDIATPTLWDHLLLIKQSNQKVLQEYADTFSAMLFIKNMYMIDAKTSYKTGKPHYYPVSAKSKMLDILLKLSNSDGEQLEQAIEEKLGQYQINYKIHNATCMHCHNRIPDIPVDMETVLFRRINKQQKNTR